MTKPKVSIIIPVYNAQKYIEKCAKSLFSQTYDNIEFIFVDDCSTDSSVKILNDVIDLYEERKHQVKLKSLASNKGSAFARREGMLNASGDYIIQVDSDDCVSDNYISELVNAIGDDIDIVYCDFCYLVGNKQIIHRMPELSVEEMLCSVVDGRIHASLANKLIRRSLIEDNNIYPISGINMFDDKSVVFRTLYFAKKVKHVPLALYYYNKNNESSISSLKKDNQIKNALEIVKLIDSFFSGKEISIKLGTSIEHFKIGVFAMFLLYGDKSSNYEIDSLRRKYSYKNIISQPKIPFYYKLSVIFYNCGFNLPIDFMRMIIRKFV